MIVLVLSGGGESRLLRSIDGLVKRMQGVCWFQRTARCSRVLRSTAPEPGEQHGPLSPDPADLARFDNQWGVDFHCALQAPHRGLSVHVLVALLGVASTRQGARRS